MLNPKVEDALTSIDDRSFYYKILSIPISKSKYKLFSLHHNIYNPQEILDQSIDELRSTYAPYIRELDSLGVTYDLEKKKIIFPNSEKLREMLIDELPSNLISGIVFRDEELPTEEQIEKKEKVKCVYCNLAIQKLKNLKQFDNIKENYINRVKLAFVSNFTISKQIMIEKQISRIMKKHTNSRVFLILMSKWFFIAFWFFKLLVKISIIYYFYKKSGNLHIPFVSDYLKVKKEIKDDVERSKLI